MGALTPEQNEIQLTALVVGGAPLAEALSDDGAAGGAGFEVERIEDPTSAIDLARALAPDVVVLDVELPGALSLAEALMSDPLTEPVPVLAVGRFARPEDAAPYIALGAARALPRPVSPDTLRRAAAEAAATYVRGEVVRAPLGDVTLDELGARLAEELRRGLCDAAEAKGRAHRIELGEGAEVLAALWGAVARIRDVVTIRSQGTVRFALRGPEGALPLAPWLGPDKARGRGRAEGVRGRGAAESRGRVEEGGLDGLSAVVADDDPAVTWFVAGVLRAAGATVHEAHDGARALDLAYQMTPDLVVSDVLMPRLDGFALCRSLKRDVVLRDVPVILLSWKEDLLQRLRELGADADGYLRKEASAAAIVQRVREVLRPRQRVAERIAGGGEVRGRLDGLTTRTLLALSCARRPASTVTVRDAAFLYEVHIREGRPVGATRTAPDGTFQRGPAVLAGLIGVGSGRFAVSPPEPDAHVATRGLGGVAGLEGSLAEQLLPAIAAARAAQLLLSGSPLLQVERVEIDTDRMSSYLDATPEPARSVLRRLMAGASPCALIAAGQAPAWLVEDVLCDAAAHGSVTRVLDRGGEDVLGAAVAREADVLRGIRRPAPPPEAPADLGEAAPVAEVDAAAMRPEPPPDPAPAAVAAAVTAAVTAAVPAATAATVPAGATGAHRTAERPKPAPPLTLGSLTPPPVIERALPAGMPLRPAEAPAEALEDSPAPRRVRRPSAYAPPPRPEPRRESRMTMWVLFAVAAFVFAVGARLSNDRAAPPVPEPAVEPANAEPRPTSAAVAPPEPPGQPGESATHPILPEDLPLPPDQRVPEGQGLLEVVAGPNDEVLIDGRLMGKGSVKASLEPKADAYEIRARLRGEERVRFAQVKPGRLTRLRVSPPWRR